MNRWLDQQPLLLQALGGTAQPQAWQPADWAEALQQARMAGLSGRVGERLSAACSGAGVLLHPGAAAQFEAAARLWRAQQAELKRELRFLSLALADLDAPVVLLKGAAYAAAGLPAAQGRLFSDIDILIPKEQLAAAERLLNLAGWVQVPKSAYDAAYYRKWMHELPPMQHVHRHTILDVHHTLLPETARLRPDAARLFSGLVPVEGFDRLRVLAPAEMVLHTSMHLFMNEVMTHALRDLSDIDLLLRQFGQQAAFWDDLVAATRAHRLGRLLYYALRYTTRVFGTPVPEGITGAVTAYSPSAALRAGMDALWLHALQPHALASRTAAGRSMLLALYIRGHWLRMPPWMLARHLAIKALGNQAAENEGVQTVG